MRVRARTERRGGLCLAAFDGWAPRLASFVRWGGGQAAHYTVNRGERHVNVVGVYLRPSARLEARGR
eukprot:2321073-Alexandrium_andersonii.AAC.1